jgi:hypothetical protein
VKSEVKLQILSVLFVFLFFRGFIVRGIYGIQVVLALLCPTVCIG